MEACPWCGADLPSHADFCRECGASKESGWGEDDGDWEASVPDDGFEYDEFIAREFPDQASPPLPTSRPQLARVLIVVLILVILWGAFQAVNLLTF